MCGQLSDLLAFIEGIDVVLIDHSDELIDNEAVVRLAEHLLQIPSGFTKYPAERLHIARSVSHSFKRSLGCKATTHPVILLEGEQVGLILRLHSGRDQPNAHSDQTTLTPGLTP